MHVNYPRSETESTLALVSILRAGFSSRVLGGGMKSFMDLLFVREGGGRGGGQWRRREEGLVGWLVGWLIQPVSEEREIFLVQEPSTNPERLSFQKKLLSALTIIRHQHW